MKNTKRQKVVRTLCEAKKLLDPPFGSFRGYRFICIAINVARQEGIVTQCEADLTKKVIMRRLGRYISVEGYLRQKCNIGESRLTRRNVQEFRHRWVDALIEEFKAPAQR